MQTVDDADDEGQQRQGAEGRRRAEQKLHECVLEMMELPETAALRAQVLCPAFLSGIDVRQQKEVMKRARKEWEANLKTAILRRPQHMPSQVAALADIHVMRTQQKKSKSMRKTAKRAEQQWHAHKHENK